MRDVMSRFFAWYCILFPCYYSWASNITKDAVSSVVKKVMISGAEKLQSKVLNIDERTLYDALGMLAYNQNSYTLASEPSRICVESTHSLQGLQFLIEPQSYMEHSANDFGLSQEKDGTSKLQFFNQERQVALPYFLIMRTSLKATDRGLLEEQNSFTIGGSEKPMGSPFKHLQAGAWGEIIGPYEGLPLNHPTWQIDDCLGTLITIEFAILNRDLVRVASGNYMTSLSVQVNAIG